MHVWDLPVTRTHLRLEWESLRAETNETKMKGVKKKKMRVVSEKQEQQATETDLFTNTTVDERKDWSVLTHKISKV